MKGQPKRSGEEHNKDPLSFILDADMMDRISDEEKNRVNNKGIF
jgi:hypothetical protein